ncbi:hypothetical protein ONS95_013828 [Cadophora gregata]|uniref:uncharacterized protein n=1 Tax=Cadophora gregata TaxID=51156 RepID=UPI0026DD4D82|nr:uncharacterized protein ONS95_013828 [Cadophora gregata]KAK0113580.1 hypothetical protein ONS96_014436 [Cadophora gregata f. sp. sojae]KAK0114336.1 hypothetical protein ONS95_013828 [Cadophora gregata]
MLIHGSPGYDGVFDIPLGFKIPRAAHHVIGLTAEEATVALEFGPTRVIAHLGESERCFPSPVWADRDRKNCCTMADQANSGRSKFKLARIYGVNALLDGGFDSGNIILTLPPGEKKIRAIQAAFRNLSKDMMFGFDSFMSERATSALTWRTGQTVPKAYGKSSSTNLLNLAFIGFVNYTTDQKNDCIIIDDGYCMFLLPDSWAKIQQAVAAVEDCTIPLGGQTFVLKWLRPMLKSPHDRPVLERFKTNEPVIKPLTKSHVELVGMTFLHEPTPTIVSAMAMCEYVERIRQLLCDLMPPYPPPGIREPCQTLTIRLQFPTLPGGALATKCDPSDAGVDANLVSNAMILVPLEFKDTPPEGELVYLCHAVFGLWGYMGQ